MNILDANKREIEQTIQDVQNKKQIITRRSEKKTFSIITLTNNDQTYINFLNTLLLQETDYTFELIPLLNHNNQFKSCAQALNYGMSLANSDYYILCHHDILCKPNWIQRFKEAFDTLSEKYPNLGFIGPAGTSKLNHPTKSNIDEYAAVYLTQSIKPWTGKDESFADYWRRQWGSIKEVQCLDECVMACKSNLGIRYDDVNFDHYHFYGGDICLYALSKGLRNFSVDVEVDHLSGGVENLRNPVHRQAFVEYGSRLFKKWRDKLPYFRTTCAIFYGPEKVWVPEIMRCLRQYGITVPEQIKVM